MGDRRLAWFLSGLAVAALICGLSAAARAQEPQRNTGESFAGGASGPSRGRPDAQAIEDGFAAPGIPPPVPVDDPSEVPEEQDGLDPVPRAGQRAVVQDGDPNFPADPTLQRDGIVDVGEPLPPEDGTDPITVDTRSAEDLAVFDNPPAGFDPLLFQIEDLDPIQDNRLTTRLFRQEPFDPIGIKIGSFVLFPELELGGSWYSNVFRATAADGDVAADVRPSARLVSNWSSHALEFRATGGLSYFNEFTSENDKAYLIESRGRLDMTRRTNLQGLVSREQTLESRSALDASSAGSRTTQITERAEAALNHRFNRLSLQFRGSVIDTAFGDSENLGVSTSNSDRDYTAYEETARASWEFKPTHSVFAEAEVNQRDYDTVARSDLINRSSDGQRYRAGLSFGNTGQILRGEASLGYGVQTPDDKRLAEIDGLILDANATWRVSELTSVLFNASSDVSETTTTNVGGAFTRSAGVEVRHALRRYLVASAGLTYSTQDSQDGIIDENELRTTLGLEYFANRETVLFGRYGHTSFESTDGLTDYDADEIKVGVRLRR